MSAEDAPEVIDVPVKQFAVNITLDSVLTTLMQQADTLAQPGPAGISRLAVTGDSVATADAGDPSQSDVAQRLQRMRDLASQLKEELNQLDPNVLTQLKQLPAPSE